MDDIQVFDTVEREDENGETTVEKRRLGVVKCTELKGREEMELLNVLAKQGSNNMQSGRWMKGYFKKLVDEYVPDEPLSNVEEYSVVEKDSYSATDILNANHPELKQVMYRVNREIPNFWDVWGQSGDG